MAHVKNHDYQILPPSIWPFLGAIGAFVMLTGAVAWMKGITFFGAPIEGPWMFLIGFVAVLYVMFGWWADVITEGESGEHTPVVRIGLQYGFILFIMSEVMFFVAWFWAFIKNAMYPMGPDSPIKDGVWPPEGIVTFDPWHLPLINTLILLLSGVAVTWAHHAFVHEGDRKTTINGLIVAVILGLCFTALQAYEYSHAAFGLADTVYAGAFYMATGFHGVHVIIGTIFLFVCLIRLMRGQMTQKQHIGFEAAAWYWHFVDVVWLFLFVVVYIWGR
ncbi:cytochrome c oxidase subunit 3 [Paracoccus aestuariivivens]|uniref:Cytochrome c oxidase subunit 3 n=1 Tax=Paracoccus aestuariivivens TaxID=1820333 RepID=A0A6L6JFC9_9RHOB|nr:cytochrome c oxidase subunit 3 [Paracoccus aestuariivivens]MTH78601.1 cytochrome c oxidase subunit 3 [Paracoccus aestuariivivens]